MRVDNSGSLLLFGLGQNKTAGSGFGDGRQITALLNRQAANRMGIVEGTLPGNYRPVYAETRQKVEEDVYATRDVTRSEAVYEDRTISEMRDVYEARDVYENRDVYESRDVFETRDVYETRDIYESRDVMATRDVTEMRDITETRNVYETQATFENRAIMETKVEGNRSLTPYNTLSQADIDIGADFAIQVGNDATATFRFTRSDRLAVTVNGSTQNFNFTSAAGSMRDALLSALNSVAGLDASYTQDGRLSLMTDGASSLRLADVANGLLDFSRSPLAKLGLTAGTTNASVSGYEQVQTGTQQVVVGTETVVVGQQQVVVGSESYVAGTEQVLVGQEQVVVGQEQTLVGQEQVRVGSESVLVGQQQFLIGTQSFIVGVERVQVGERSVAAGTERVKVGTKTTEEVSGLTLVGLEEDTDRGLGASTLLDRLAQGSLPHGYLEALFGALPEEEADAALTWPGGEAAPSDALQDDAKPASPTGR